MLTTTQTKKIKAMLDKISAVLTGAPKAKKSAAEMRCRAPGCKERSRGPRFAFRCKKHTMRGYK